MKKIFLVLVAFTFWLHDSIANIGVAGQNTNVFRNLHAAVVGSGSVLNVLNTRTFRVMCNTINMQIARYGFHLQGANSIYLKENTVLSSDPAGNIHGWFMASSDYNTLIMNSVSGISGNIQSNDAFTFSIANFNRIINNAASHTRYGFNFQGVCTDSYFLGNTTADHFTGLHLGTSGIMGAQFHRGNKWFGPYSYIVFGNQIGAVNENNSGDPNDILQSEFRIHTQVGTIWHPYSYVPNLLGAPWFNVDLLGTPAAETYQNDCHIPDEPRSYSVEKVDSLIVSGSLSAVEFPAESQWMGARTLVEKLSQSDSLQTINSFFEWFYDSSLTGNTGKLNSFHQIIRQSWNENSAFVQEANHKDSIVRASLYEISLLDSSISLLTDTVEIMLLTEQRKILYQNIVALVNEINSLRTTIKNSIQAAIESADAENSSVTAAAVIENNEKTVNRIKAKFFKFGKDSLPVTDFNDLLSVAIQCPLAGGKAVYVARTLYNIFNDTIFYDDASVCALLGYYRKKNGESHIKTCSVFVFPNPAQEKISIIETFSEDEQTSYEIFDASGVLIQEGKLTPSDGYSTIQTDKLSNGIYSLIVRSKNSLSHPVKMAVIK
jgi:hypothetical protein